MDIDLLSKMVKELILDNDRVVLPGLGSFVAEIVPSTFSDKGYTINPPYRRLYFRSKPDEGNELAAFYADRNNIEVKLAERIVTDFVSELKELLHAKKTIVFPALGRLRATKENNVFFVADEDLDIYPAGFGLEPVSLKTHQETQEEVTAAVEELKSYLEMPVLEAASEPVPETEPDPVPAPVPDPEVTDVVPAEPVDLPEVVTQTAIVADDAETASASVQEKERSAGKTIKKVLLLIAFIAVLLLVALAVLGRTCPDFVDGFLYSPEELKILNHLI